MHMAICLGIITPTANMLHAHFVPPKLSAPTAALHRALPARTLSNGGVKINDLLYALFHQVSVTLQPLKFSL
jgi:hypothetical protein